MQFIVQLRKRSRLAIVAFIFTFIGSISGVAYGLYSILLGWFSRESGGVMTYSIFGVLYLFISVLLLLLELGMIKFTNKLSRGILIIILSIFLPIYITIILFLGGILYVLSYLLENHYINYEKT